ncbi:MAG TPA: xylosidase/arabinosidase [Bdellovibrionota bacterium]|nr:xylosidase/arabinosidase [Bdellovibrionota bacterium]
MRHTWILASALLAFGASQPGFALGRPKPAPSPSPRPALVTRAPAPVALDEGRDAELSVDVRPEVTLVQWRKDGADLPGRTGTVLHLEDAQHSEQGNYSVRVTAGSRNENSAAALVTVRPNEIVDQSQFVHQVFAGYQGWFAARGDGGLDQWFHWSGSDPAPGRVTFELYPDVREYNPEDLFQTGLGPLGNGQPARLFSSNREAVIHTHFRWAREYGLDGFAVQRFAVGIRSDGRERRVMNDTLGKIRRQAEAWEKSFYVMWDLSGLRASEIVPVLQADLEQSLERGLGVFGSPRYARQDGRPVIAIWGLGFAGREDTPEQASQIIQWLKARGFFVVGGVPYWWREGVGDARPGWTDTFAQFDMLIPWAVGRFGSDEDVRGHFRDIVSRDEEFCRARGIHYQRVIFPGFAWSNWNAPPRNGIPRRNGDFFWTQAFEASFYKRGAFIAMFDEYDEGTAIAKAAENASMIPNDQYFLTLDADGRDLSSDFYLRLAGEATRMIQGSRSRTRKVPIADR